MVDERQEHRQAAQATLAALLAELRALPDREAVSSIIDEGEHLARAIEAFHMEAIRFRIFGLIRRLEHPAAPVPDTTRQLVTELRGSLERAGFHTRSIHS